MTSCLRYGAKAGALGDMQWGRNRRRPLDTANYLTQAPRCRSPRAVARNHNSRKTVGCANRNLEPSVYDDYPKPNRRKPLPIALTSYDGLWSQVRSGITNRICQHLTEFSLRLVRLPRAGFLPFGHSSHMGTPAKNATFSFKLDFRRRRARKETGIARRAIFFAF